MMDRYRSRAEISSETWQAEQANFPAAQRPSHSAAAVDGAVRRRICLQLPGVASQGRRVLCNAEICKKGPMDRWLLVAHPPSSFSRYSFILVSDWAGQSFPAFEGGLTSKRPVDEPPVCLSSNGTNLFFAAPPTLYIAACTLALC